MSAGLMRDSCVLLTVTPTDDGRGGQTVDWDDATETPVFAEVRDATSREQANAGAVQVLATHIVNVPFREDVTTSQRVKRLRDALTLEIVGIRDVDGRRRQLELTCTKVI